MRKAEARHNNTHDHLRVTRKTCATHPSLFVSLFPMRKLKHHEQRLLKKVDIYGAGESGKKEQREVKIMRKYYLQDREDYTKFCLFSFSFFLSLHCFAHSAGVINLRYNKLVGLITKLVSEIKSLPPSDPVRIQVTDQLLDKLLRLLYTVIPLVVVVAYQFIVGIMSCTASTWV